MPADPSPLADAIARLLLTLPADRERLAALVLRPATAPAAAPPLSGDAP